MKKFTVNNKVYPAKEITFEFMCELEDANVALEEMIKKKFKMATAYLAYCMGADYETASAEINAHVIGGGNIVDVVTVAFEALEESDFFRKLIESMQTEESPEEVGETQKKTRTRKTAEA